MLRNDYWYRFPWLLLAVALALVGLGIAGIYAATSGRAEIPPVPAHLRGLAVKQALLALVALAVFAAALVPSYTRIARYSYHFYAASVAALVVLALMRWRGWTIPRVIYPINYAYSWIRIPGVPIGLQPSELTKIAFIMALAWYLRYRKNFRTFPGLLVPFAMALVPTALVLYQPDLGTAMLFLPVLFLMLFAAGARAKHLLAIIALGLACVPFFYASMHGYQRLRIDAWLLQGAAERMHFALAEAQREAEAEAEAEAAAEGVPLRRTARAEIPDAHKAELVREITAMWRFRLWRLAGRISWGAEDPQFEAARGRLDEALEAGPGPTSFRALRQFFATLLARPGHQLLQAKTAVGAGGLGGRGWLEGTQTRYGLLPEAHTDFLFPTLAEQFGFWGAALVVVLYGLLCLFGLDVSFSTTEPYGRLVVVGVVALVAAQSFLNLAMSVGLMPITGIPLPFMSYGGSSLLASFLALGLLANVALRRLYLIAPRPFEWSE